jgi:F0F1-type ATP synthase assembly protein I
MSNKENPSPWRLIRLGTTMAALVAGGVLIGWFVDTRAHTQPVFTLTGLAVGMAATCWYGYATFRRFM